MANIAITSLCNLNCSYCFAKNERKADTQHMVPEVYQQSLDFIIRSGIKEIRILGGEPTLHPDFISYMEKALDTGYPVRIFSNGEIPEQVLNFLKNIPDTKLNVVLNITRFAENPDETIPAIEKTLKLLNGKIMPGLNVFKKTDNFDFIFNMINDFGLKKSVRLGLAHPCIGSANRYLNPKHYFFEAGEIIEFMKNAGEQKVKIVFDCGFVPCMFHYDENINFYNENRVEFHCEPIPDIMQDGSIVPCYSLSAVKRMMPDKDLTAGIVRGRMIREIPEYSNFGIFKVCTDCSYKKKGFCTGGCAAQKIMRSNAIVPDIIEI